MRAGRLTTAFALILAAAGCSVVPTQPEPPAPAAPPEAPPLAQRFVDAAMAMQGQPYRYGGDAPGGFDCSGLIAYAAKQSGIAVPRTAHEQLHAGVEISRAAMLPGDLVFMRLKRELHVGIVIGPGAFLHAPSSGGRVRVDELDARPYRAAFIAARRILP